MDLLVLKALADNIALAIEGAQLLFNRAETADQISTVVEVSRLSHPFLTSMLCWMRLVNLIIGGLYPFVHLYA